VSASEDQIRAAAMRVFRTRQAADAFLTLPCPALGGAPNDLVKSGRDGEVLSFLDKLEHEAPPEAPTMARLFSGWLGRFGGRR
jgi:hypothetical protein